MALSKIEWTNSSWNPLTGCTKISLGCQNCYAERMARRLMAMGNPNYKNGFKMTLHEKTLELPLKWKTPKYIFVNSMSDLFHEDVPDDFIIRIFKVMQTAYWHTFQVLTKRSERLIRLNEKINWSPNIWMGVSVETPEYLYRIEHLRKSKAVIKFLSLEPLLEQLNGIDLSQIDWVIVGGESGPGARKMHEDWVLEIKDSCLKQNVPFFFKQWGGVNKKKNGRLLEGKYWDQMPLKRLTYDYSYQS
jgi:protein gp37